MAPRPVFCIHLPSDAPPAALSRALDELSPTMIVLDAESAHQFPPSKSAPPDLIFVRASANAPGLAEWAGGGLRWFGSSRDNVRGRAVHWFGEEAGRQGDTSPFDLFAGGVACGRYAVRSRGGTEVSAAVAALGLLAEARLAALPESGPVLAALRMS